MIRMTIAGVAGFLLVFVESYIVMMLKGYHTIEFGGISPFISVWAMNFFLMFAICTHFKLWHDQKQETKGETSTEL